MSNKAYGRIATALTVLSALGLGASVAQANSGSNSILKGGLEVRQADGTWKTADVVGVGDWVRSAKGDTTVNLAGTVVRLDKRAVVKFDTVGQSLHIQSQGGRVYVSSPVDSKVQVSTPEGTFAPFNGEAMLDTSLGRAVPLGGQPLHFDRTAPTVQPMLALDGGDLRIRNQGTRRKTEGTSNTGKKIGEDVPVNNTTTTPTFNNTTPPPTGNTSPPPTGNTSPPPTGNTSPPPTGNTTPPPQIGGGGPDWGWIGGGLGVAGLALFLALNNNNDNNNNNVVAPITQ